MKISSPVRILLTGASGVLGRHVVGRLSARPDAEVLGLMRSARHIDGAGPNVRFLPIDLNDTDAVRRLLYDFNPTCIIHSAASALHSPQPGWSERIRFNVDVSIALCEGAAAIPRCHFVYISSGLAYREQHRPLLETDPLDTLHPYGASKGAADLLIRSAAAEFGVPLTVIRPFSFTGVGDPPSRLFPSLIAAAVAGEPLDFSPGDQFRDHSATADIAEGIAASVFLRPPTAPDLQVFNLGSGRVIPLRTMVESVMDQLGLKVRLNVGARPYARYEPMYLVADTTRARNVLGWTASTNLAYSVWQFARKTYPELQLTEPQRFLV